MRRFPPALILVSLLFTMCADRDLRSVRPDRTRDADGIIKLYGNKRQGDWMLKGKGVQVNAAIVVEKLGKGSTVTVTARETLTPLLIPVQFAPTERRAASLQPGDLVTFKGICSGMNGSLRFESCISLGVSKPVERS